MIDLLIRTDTPLAPPYSIPETVAFLVTCGLVLQPPTKEGFKDIFGLELARSAIPFALLVWGCFGLLSLAIFSV